MFQTIGDAALKQKQISQPKSQRRPIYLGIDVPILLVTITLAIFGLLMVYSASWDYSLRLYGDPTRIFIRQVAWLGLGMIVVVILAWLDYHLWQRLALPAMIGTIVLLVGVLFINEVRNGAVRTLLGGSIQPSELAKLVTIIYLTVWLHSKRAQLKDVSFGLIPLASIIGIVGGLILVQPDLSAVITIFVLGGMLFFLAGGDMRQILILVILAIIVGMVVVLINPTGNDRIGSFLPGLRDPTQANYHVRRSLEALVKGGWIGVGIGKADTKLTGLPVPPTDSIFAVIGEEIGVLGATVLIGLYLIFLWRGLEIARRAPDGLGALLAAGLSLWIVMEAIVNMAVMLNLLPFAGNALPFISAGGSSMIVSLAGVGILLNISRLSVKTKEKDRRLQSAVVDLRRWDRRRSVSRPRRSASANER